MLPGHSNGSKYRTLHLPPGPGHLVIPTEAQPSGGTWLETQTSLGSKPDFSTALRFSRNDNGDA